MKTIFQLIVAILALTVTVLSYAEDQRLSGTITPRVYEVQNFSSSENLCRITEARPFIDYQVPNEEVQPDTIGQVYNTAQNTLHSLVSTLSKPLIKIDSKEFKCLARNIFFEAGSEPEEGKVAVGLVTLNRVSDGRFRNTVCGVVNQKLSMSIPKQQIVARTKSFGMVQEKHTVWTKLSVCQFSWRCMFVRDPKSHDDRWLESQRIARELLEDTSSFEPWRAKYSSALYFHAISIRPKWAHQKKTVNRIGGHIFYSERI